MYANVCMKNVVWQLLDIIMTILYANISINSFKFASNRTNAQNDG